MARILVIEDDLPIRELLRHSLERSGHRVAEAADGKEGLAAQRVMPFDLVITDIIMPGMEGLETILEFRRRFGSTKIIAISGGGMGKAGDYLALASRFGANRTAAKPFSMTRLNALVTEVLEDDREPLTG